VAGFLDFGESLEECAVREVREETGIEVKNVRYVGSQSWPFPSQLMAGFVAEYAAGEIKADENEIAEARWFTRESLPDSFPPHRSIARWIIERYLLNRNGAQGALD
jgi:NAD+ diphosphatase